MTYKQKIPWVSIREETVIVFRLSFLWFLAYGNAGGKVNDLLESEGTGAQAFRIKVWFKIVYIGKLNNKITVSQKTVVVITN